MAAPSFTRLLFVLFAALLSFAAPTKAHAAETDARTAAVARRLALQAASATSLGRFDTRRAGARPPTPAAPVQRPASPAFSTPSAPPNNATAIGDFFAGRRASAPIPQAPKLAAHQRHVPRAKAKAERRHNAHAGAYNMQMQRLAR